MEADIQAEITEKFWNQRCFILITGASRGIGRALALHLANIVGPASLFLLSARDEQSLMTLKGALEEINPALLVQISKYDYSQPDADSLDQMLCDSMTAFDTVPENFSRAVCFHNAGSLGDITKKSSEYTNLAEITNYFQLNLVSVIILTSKFLQLFSSTSACNIVNISSLCAIQPMASMSLYCTGKAARDMFFRTLAVEEPNISVLNYAPGPVDTEMLSSLITESWSPEISQVNKEMKDRGTVLKAETTVAKLASILAQSKYESGAHVDYFDDITQ